ncbi:ras-related protein Rab-8A-like isoform X2 [Antedon mediterranea]|uniref:ras-related protein Rab-8A-like isoform X2 n=1 Tax=Antedon mediterranea TaxID=105859 RepID=UPI003AF4C808
MAKNPVPKSYDFLFKCVVIGDYGVGKTSIVMRFTDDTFDTFPATIGVDFKLRTIELDGKKIKLQIWDLRMSGTRCKSVSNVYYRGTGGIMVVYDITNKESFENCQVWLNDIKEKASPDVEIILLGSKCDEDDEKRQVSQEQGQQLATEYGIKFMETSAKEAINIEMAFFTLTEDVLAKKSIELTEEPLEKKKEKSRKSGCCVL